MNLLHILMNRHVYNRKRIGHLHYFSRETALATLAIADSGQSTVSTPSPDCTCPYVAQPGEATAKIPRAALYMLPGGLGEKLLGGASLLVLATKASLRFSASSRRSDCARSIPTSRRNCSSMR